MPNLFSSAATFRYGADPLVAIEAGLQIVAAPVLDPASLIITVGAGKQFQTLNAAIAAAGDGAILLVDAGTYLNDFATITRKISVIGVGGMVHLVATVPPSNHKGILITGNDVTIANVAFSGAALSAADGGNGAGIRYEGGVLSVQNCEFSNNQNGILGFPVIPALTVNEITINHTRFVDNGSGDGFSHNVYAGAVGKLTVTNSISESARVGHELKSLALINDIENNIFRDGPAGTGSYDIDLPNGGVALIQNNIIQKGPLSQNNAMVHFGGEGTPPAASSLTVRNNSFINDGTVNAVGVLNQTTVNAVISDNVFSKISAANIARGPAALTNNADGNAVVLCFRAGTAIATPAGEIPVEHLAVGDQVLTRFSGRAAVQWTGARRIDCRLHPDPRKVWPVRVRMGAFGDASPHRDLWLSPDHAIYIDDVLIPVRCLIDGRAIEQIPADVIVYHHIALPEHDVLLAEGAQAESCLDTGGRDRFTNGSSPVIAHPDFSSRMWEAMACAPLIFTGPLLDAARRRVDAWDRVREIA